MTVQKHLNRLRLAGYREETIRTKRRVFSLLASHIDPTPLDQASRDQLEAFLSRPGLRPATRKAYLSHFRAYYRWLVEEGLRADDPTYRIPAIRVTKGLPRPIESHDLALALRVAPPRMRAWLLLMSLAGLRCCEVSRLRPEDLVDSPTGAYLFLREMKGGNQGTVPAHKAIREQLATLPIRNGLWWSVTPSTVSIETNAFLHSCGIAATAHRLRHWSGTAWYEASGHDLLTTQRLLRHVDVSNTQVYADVDPTRPAEVAALVSLPA